MPTKIASNKIGYDSTYPRRFNNNKNKYKSIFAMNNTKLNHT